MEVVSTLCFGGDSAPEPDLIKMLMEIIYTEKEDAGVITQDLTPFAEGKKDKAPVIRSSLLQLLLEHKYDVFLLFFFVVVVVSCLFRKSNPNPFFIISSEEVKEYLKEYFDRSEAVVGGDQNLYLLCIQCFEVSLQCIYRED